MFQTTNQAINDKPCFGFWGCSMSGQTSQIRRNPDLPQGLLQLLSDVHLPQSPRSNKIYKKHTSEVSMGILEWMVHS